MKMGKLRKEIKLELKKHLAVWRLTKFGWELRTLSKEK